MASTDGVNKGLPRIEPAMEMQLISRGYQLEMLEESLKQNIIVAMDTGSGKTQIAILRIMAELDRCPPEKFIWFLAPTVDLCHQQYDSITRQLPAVTTKIFLGSENTVGWTEQRLWNAALRNVRIVVSTHDILADALVTHAFVRFEQLALLVFDEAHHCTRKHPSNRIMQRYHEERNAKGQHAVPHILGLSASPIKRSKPHELSVIEANLDAISKTPRRSREELMRYVHRPVLVRTGYDACQVNLPFGLQLGRLGPGTQSQQDKSFLSTATEEHYHYAFEEICRKLRHVREELGSWAAGFLVFLYEEKLRSLLDTEMEIDLEKTYETLDLLQRLSQCKPHFATSESIFLPSDHISPKVEKLVSLLMQYHTEKFSGIVFVRQRVTASVLSRIINLHEQTKDCFRCAPYVGQSNFSGRKKSITELQSVHEQQNTLEEFRKGKLNLLVTTNVLEEGVDIPACNMVICFDKPDNLKSFIQKRGRARQEHSVFAIMIANDDTVFSLEYWQSLEAEMIRRYQDDTRLLHELNGLESVWEDVKDTLWVKSTGAFLDANTAVSHLYHFCAVLTQEPYAMMRPIFNYREVDGGLIEATVTLPTCVNKTLRQATSRKRWLTERAAMKDSALQAYTALYKGGLVNENLLPLDMKPHAVDRETLAIAGTIKASGQYSPWRDLAMISGQSVMFQRQVTFVKNGPDLQENTTLLFGTPVAIPDLESFKVTWDASTTYDVHVDCHKPIHLTSGRLQTLRDATHLILRAPHCDMGRDERRDFVVLFGPGVEESRLEEWLEAAGKRIPATQLYPQSPTDLSYGLIRSVSFYDVPHVFSEWEVGPESDEVDAANVVTVKCIPLPRRRNFLTPRIPVKKTSDQVHEAGLKGRKERIFHVDKCTVDCLPTEIARLGLFIPTILQHVEVLMVADQLQQSVFPTLAFNDPYLLVEAITARSAHWITNYERLEFLGDSMLKAIVSIQLFIDHINWHEAYLSNKRSYLVSNANLCRTALDCGLDRFVLTEAFGGRKRTVPLISDLRKDQERPRRIKSKVLADVLEALIGASFQKGGLDMARRCVHQFLPEISSSAPPFDPIFQTHQCSDAGQIHGKSLILEENLIGHRFDDKILLREALNHPSCDLNVSLESYNRLEYLGDAVLDVIVTSTLYSTSSQPFSPGYMTMVKAALVNSDFLGYLCLSYSMEQEVAQIEQEKTTDHCSQRFHATSQIRTIPLYTFMRHQSKAISDAQKRCQERYQQLHHGIAHALREEKVFPWVLLVELKAEKFFSDIIESLIGAIFTDTRGNLDACIAFVQKIGLMEYLRRIIEEGDIDVTHPKNKLGPVSDAVMGGNE